MSGAGEVCTPPVGGRYRAEFGKPAGRGAVFAGVGLCPAGGPVNKFPAHRQGHAPAPVGASLPRRIGKPAVPVGRENWERSG